MAFICGSFRTQQEDNYDVFLPYSSTSTRKPTRRHGRSKKDATNAYADCGLDKFEALLADLDQKRQKILTEIECEDVSMVKFIYKSPNELKPIVVKLLDQRKHHNMSSLNTPELKHPKNVSFIKKNSGGNEAKEENMKPAVVCKWKPYYYFPLFVTLILALLMFSGRSFTTLCISIGWYLIPVANRMLNDSKQSNNIITKQGKVKKVKTGRKTP